MTTRPLTLIAGFESTALPLHGVDVADLTGHADRWRTDIDAVLDAGVRTFRYPLRWHRIEQTRGDLDWREADRTLGYLHERGAEVIVDLLHHTSYPAWLTDGFRDRRFPDAYVDYATAVADRYPWLPAYTLVNEPFATLFLAGHEALWPPYDHGMPGFARLLGNVLPALSRAAAAWSAALPHARHVWVDTCEHHAGTAGGPAEHAAFANDRRHLVLDLVLGRFLDDGAPHFGPPSRPGGRPSSTWSRSASTPSAWTTTAIPSGGTTSTGLLAVAPSGRVRQLAEHYGRRYGIPLALTETNLRGSPADRVTWLRYMVDQYEQAVDRGRRPRRLLLVPLRGLTDWDSLLARPAGRRDPVGILSLGPRPANGGPRSSPRPGTAPRRPAAADLPAYRLPAALRRRAARRRLVAAHWPWQSPPEAASTPATEVPRKERSAMTTRRRTPRATQQPTPGSALPPPLGVGVAAPATPGVTLRRGASGAEGGQTWFVEEPRLADVARRRCATKAQDGVTRAWLEVPRESVRGRAPGVRRRGPRLYAGLLCRALAGAGVRSQRGPALHADGADLAQASARSGWSTTSWTTSRPSARRRPGLVLRHRQALAEADVVFAGGRSLHREASAAPGRTGAPVPQWRRDGALRPGSSAAPAARPAGGRVRGRGRRAARPEAHRGARARPARLGRTIVGPVAKISPDDLPAAPNLTYAGFTPYAELPSVMAGFDVALMPFGLTAATRSISPTKTLEYLAAGLPVVSTRVPDVVTDFGDVVRLADDGREFAAACREALTGPGTENAARLRAVSRRHEWDTIARAMHQLMVEPEGYSAAYVARVTPA